jgi:hypothetical protein
LESFRKLSIFWHFHLKTNIVLSTQTIFFSRTVWEFRKSILLVDVNHQLRCSVMYCLSQTREINNFSWRFWHWIFEIPTGESRHSREYHRTVYSKRNRSRVKSAVIVTAYVKSEYFFINVFSTDCKLNLIRNAFHVRYRDKSIKHA